eukprot:403367160
MAVISHHQNIQWTYEELNTKVETIARGLIALGLNKGDRIGIYSQNKAEWTLLQFAAARADLILVNVNPAFQQSELTYALKKVGIKTLVMAESFKSSNYVKIVQDIIPELLTTKNPLDLGNLKEFPDLKNIVLLSDNKVQGMINFKDLETLSDSNDEYELQKRERSIDFEKSYKHIIHIWQLQGYPKGATLSHFNILNNAYYLGLGMRNTPEDKIIIPVPLYHCFGMVIGNLCALNFGSTMVYPSEGFDPKASLEAVTKYKGTSLYGVPTMFIAMLEEYKKNPSAYDISTLRTGFIAGSGVPEVLVHRIENELGIKEFTHGYGLTECSPVVSMSTAHDPLAKKAQTVGRTMPHVELKIINPETSQTLKWGEPGEVCARGYGVMTGYFNDQEKSKDTICPKGWLRTGDLGQFDEDGFLKIIGRSKDMIIRGGENIYPREIEEFFMSHSNVLDVQVIGVTDEFMGEEEKLRIIKSQDTLDWLTASLQP